MFGLFCERDKLLLDANKLLLDAIKALRTLLGENKNLRSDKVDLYIRIEKLDTENAHLRAENERLQSENDRLFCVHREPKDLKAPSVTNKSVISIESTPGLVTTGYAEMSPVTSQTRREIEEMTNEEIARVAHEVNRAYCASIGDNSQLGWEDAEAWQRESAVKGVQFHRENPDVTPEQSHESWLAEKVATGWKYGPSKDPENKLHPCMVPYSELPQAQRSKDFIFGAVVASLIKDSANA